MGDWEQKNQVIINELAQGRELAKQLQSHMNMSNNVDASCQMLVDKILASYYKVLSMLNSTTTLLGSSSLLITPPPLVALHGSPRSNDSDPDCKNTVLEKRKSSITRWSKQVRLRHGMGIEDDGFGWRKYGQKDILGAKHPRGYYRCTHRYDRGCLATKQVQRSDEDPTIFEITYKGNHICNQSPNSLFSLTTPQTLHQTHRVVPINQEPLQIQSQQLLINHSPLHISSDTSNVIDNENLRGDYSPSFLAPANNIYHWHNLFDNFEITYDTLPVDCDSALEYQAGNSDLLDSNFMFNNTNFFHKPNIS